MKKIICVILSLTSISLFALTGEEIIQNAKNANQGFESESSEMKLILKEADKVLAERKLRSKTIELSSDFTSKTLIEFLQPADVKGTKFLTWLHKKDNKSQWIYLPALSKTRKILAGDQSSSFMGSEFTYEDIGGQETSKFNYKLLSEIKDPNDQKDTLWKVEQKSKDNDKKDYQVISIKKSIMGPILIEYMNSRNEKTKVSMLEEYKEFSVGGKKMFRPHKISMKNLITGNESIFQWDKRELGSKLKESEFSSSAMDLK